jgi:epoxyqueuosine reductase
MKKSAHNQRLTAIVTDFYSVFDIAAIAVVNINSPTMNRVQQALVNFTVPPQYSSYLVESLPARRNFNTAFPWANSIVIAAIPFSALPQLPELPAAKSRELSGIIAGYASREDYHLAGKNILQILAEQLQAALNDELRYQICIDTAPLAERIIAAVAGIGQVGLNHCLLTQGYGSGCFIASLLTDADLTEIVLPHLPRQSQICHCCHNCLKSCRNQAININSHFDINRCISYLTMEKRGLLTKTEMQSLGDNIFGCSNCTSICPDSNLPQDIAVDLEWLLLAPTAAVKRAIRGSALEYAGVTTLRRNAIAVLANRRHPAATELIRRASHSGSNLLRQSAAAVLTDSELV